MTGKTCVACSAWIDRRTGAMLATDEDMQIKRQTI